MSQLTIETMDRINFLLTEVSLECLGNKFYDIYGNQTESLLHLVSVDSLQQKPVIHASESKLLNALRIDPDKFENARKVPAIQLSDVTRKRRMSLSDKDKSKIVQNDPESLLMPMNPPKTAKIANRRQTINISQPQVQQTFKEPIRIANNHRTSSKSLKPMKPLTIAELKQQLKRDINEMIGFMRIESESEERKYKKAHPGTTDSTEFYKNEKKKLFMQCNTLIQFIKLMQMNPENNQKLKNVSEVILELQKEF